MRSCLIKGPPPCTHLQHIHRNKYVIVIPLETRKNNMNKFSMLNGSPPPLISDLVLRAEKLSYYVRFEVCVLRSEIVYSEPRSQEADSILNSYSPPPLTDSQVILFQVPNHLPPPITDSNPKSHIEINKMCEDLSVREN